MLSEFILKSILEFAKKSNYSFTTVTPSTHEIVLNRRPEFSTDLRDIFGWNTCFLMDNIAPELKSIFSDAEFFYQHKKSPVRIASFEQDLFLHSSYPTLDHDSVFFGPDTYRFLRFIQRALQNTTEQQSYRILDIGCGSGAGGIVAARALKNAAVELVMNDINPTALTFTRVNARAAGLPICTALGDAFNAVQGKFDVIVCNPPFLYDEAQRAYRHGGKHLGRDLGVRLTREALHRLNPGGKYILYTGVVMTDEQDPFLDEIRPYLLESGYQWVYEEIDPDIFGEELRLPVYERAERIAAVGLVVTAPITNSSIANL